MGSPCCITIVFRYGGVFSLQESMTTSEETLAAIKKEIKSDKKEIKSAILAFNSEDLYQFTDKEVDNCLSDRLSGGKGYNYVLSGVFNYFSIEFAEALSAFLSEKLRIQIIMCVKEDLSERISIQVFYKGKLI